MTPTTSSSLKFRSLRLIVSLNEEAKVLKGGAEEEVEEEEQVKKGRTGVTKRETERERQRQRQRERKRGREMKR